MQVGILLLFTEHRDFTDAEMYHNDIRLAVEAEAMGYDVVGCVEHHFDDYSLSPDNAQVLSYIAAKTSKVKLMPAAFILPWNDPLRVVEKTILLDIVSEGRAILGMGRGLARIEFEGFRVPMEEARGRFDEAVEMIINGLRTGYVEGNGKYYRQPRVEVRPRGFKSFDDRAYMVSMSPSSAAVATKLGLGCFKFAGIPWEEVKPEVEAYRIGYQKVRNKPAPPLVAADFICMGKTMERAKEIETYLRRYGASVLKHYETAQAGNFKTADGSYQSYAETAQELAKLTLDEQIDLLSETWLVGTPEMILEKLRHRHELIGDFDIIGQFSWGGLPYDMVREQMKLFAEEVMPVLKSWGGSSALAAAE